MIRVLDQRPEGRKGQYTDVWGWQGQQPGVGTPRALTEDMGKGLALLPTTWEGHK
jgi:hypothetical protein